MGGAAIAAALVAGVITEWSAAAWAAIGILVTVYLGVPGTTVALSQLESSARRSSNAARLQHSPRERGAMSWDPRLNSVVMALAKYLHDPDAIRVVAIQAGLAVQHLRVTGVASNDWHWVLDRALDQGEEAVDHVLALALARSDRKELHTAVADYRSSS